METSLKEIDPVFICLVDMFHSREIPECSCRLQEFLDKISPLIGKRLVSKEPLEGNQPWIREISVERECDL